MSLLPYTCGSFELMGKLDGKEALISQGELTEEEEGLHVWTLEDISGTRKLSG